MIKVEGLDYGVQQNAFGCPVLLQTSLSAALFQLLLSYF